MNEGKPLGFSSPIEILVKWEGPAVHEPGVLFEDKYGQNPLDAEPAELVGWIAVTALSGMVAHPVHQAIRKRVLGVLAQWRRHFGQAKIDEVKQLLILEMQRWSARGKVSNEEMRRRIDLLFSEIQV